jgi:hypothetical protein
VVGMNLPPFGNYDTKNILKQINEILSFSPVFRHSTMPPTISHELSVLLTFKMFSVCKDFFMSSMRPRLLVELSQA